MDLQEEYKNIKVEENESSFPIIIEAVEENNLEDLEDWIKSNSNYLQQKIKDIGAILFRGFDVKTPEDFERIAKLIDTNLCDKHPFDGDARMWLTEHVYEADLTVERNMRFPIPCHNEDSYISYLPSTVMFCCLKPAETGGETIIADCRKIFSSLSDGLQKKYLNEQLEITFTYPDSVFLVNSCLPKNQKKIENFAKEQRATNYRRVGESNTEFIFNVPAVIETSKNIFSYVGRAHFADYLTYAIDIFFSYRNKRKIIDKLTMITLILVCIGRYLKYSYHSFFTKDGKRYWCSFKNDKKIPIFEQIKITLAVWRCSTILPLKSSDILVLNNLLVSHGRLPYKGKRVLLSCIGSVILNSKDNS